MCIRDSDYKEMDKQMNREIELGLVMSPQDVNTFDTLDRQNDAFAPEIEAQNAEDDHARELEKEKSKPKLPAPKPSNNTK